MMYKNSFRILFSSASLIWKVMLYFLVIGGIVGGLTYATALPIINVLKNEGLFSTFGDIFKSFFQELNLSALFANVRDLAQDFFIVMRDNMGQLLVYIILFVFVLVILGSFLKGLYSVICGGVLYNSMSNNIKQPFVNSIVTNIGKATKLELARLTVSLPFTALIAVILYYMALLISVGGAMYVIAPFLIILAFIILISLKTALLCGWMPALFVIKARTYPALFKGFGVIRRRFWETFGTAIAMVLTVTVVNAFAAVFSFGVGLLITIPASYVLFAIFEMVSFYTARGIRFYTDSETIFEPKKVELTDRKKDIKYIM